VRDDLEFDRDQNPKCLNVRFGSKADIEAPPPMSALPLKADIRHFGGMPIKSRFPISTPDWRMMSGNGLGWKEAELLPPRRRGRLSGGMSANGTKQK
jgi:hypothetical protein